jgi:hypothetical protein
MELVRWLTVAPVYDCNRGREVQVWALQMDVPPKYSGQRAAPPERVLVVQHRQRRFR